MGAHPNPAVVEVVAPAPERRPGAVALLLEHLERRETRATWHVPADVDDALLFRLAFARHEACPAAASPAELVDQVAELRARQVDVHGASVAAGDASAARRAAEAAGLSYVCVPGLVEPLPTDGGLPVALPLVPPADVASRPLAWLRGAQVAVGAAVRGEAPLRLVLEVERLDRPDAFAVVVETLELVEGLVAAGRLRTLTLAELAEEPWYLSGP